MKRPSLFDSMVVLPESRVAGSTAQSLRAGGCNALEPLRGGPGRRRPSSSGAVPLCTPASQMPRVGQADATGVARRANANTEVHELGRQRCMGVGSGSDAPLGVAWRKATVEHGTDEGIGNDADAGDSSSDSGDDNSVCDNLGRGHTRLRRSSSFGGAQGLAATAQGRSGESCEAGGRSVLKRPSLFCAMQPPRLTLDACVRGQTSVLATV